MKEDWIEIEFGKLCAFSQGIQVPIKEQFTETNNDRVRFLRIVDFTQGDEPERYVKRIEGNHLVSKDDISMVRYGTVGFVCTGKQGAIANNLFRIIPNTNVDKKYLIQFLKSSLFRQYINAKGATMQALSFGLIKPILIPLAPLPIQRAIVSKIETLFSDLDNGIADLKKAQEQLKIYRQAVLKKAFEGKLSGTVMINDDLDKHDKEENHEPHTNHKNQGSDNLPKGWKWCTVEESSDKIVDCLHSTPKFQEKGKYCVDTTCIINGQILWDKIRYVTEESFIDRIRRLKPQKDDIIFAREGTVGTTIVLDKNVDICLGQRMMMFRLKQNIYPKYFMYYFQSNSFISQYKPLIGGTTSPHLNIRDIKKLRLPLCPIQEQHQIVREIESRLSVCDKVEQNITEALQKSEALRQSILKKAFEGKLLSEAEIEKCKQEADYEPGGVLLEKIKSKP